MNDNLEMVMRVHVKGECSTWLEVGDFNEAPSADFVEIRPGDSRQSKDWFGSASFSLRLEEAEALAQALQVVIAHKRSAK